MRNNLSRREVLVGSIAVAAVTSLRRFWPHHEI